MLNSVRRRALIGALLVGFVLAGGLAAGPAEAASAPQSVRLTYRGTGGERDYLLFVPPHDEAIPLVVYLHGCGAPPSVPGLNELAQRRSFAVAYPVQSRAADTKGCWRWSAPDQHQRGAGEPAIIAGIARQVIKAEGIDPTRVFLTGHSAGSGMTANVVAAYPDLFAAAGLIAGCGQSACLDVTGYSAYQQMGPYARAVPAYILWGTDDPTNSYLTGRLQQLQWMTMNDWADDGLPDLSSSTAVSALSYAPATARQPAFLREGVSGRCSEVQLTTVFGMGHVPDATWPVAFPDMIDFLLRHPIKAGC